MVSLSSSRKSLAENETWPAKDLKLVANGVIIQPKRRINNRRTGNMRN